MMSATATLGLILLWDVDGGLTQIDKYLYSSEDNIKVNITHIGMFMYGQATHFVHQWCWYDLNTRCCYTTVFPV